MLPFSLLSPPFYLIFLVFPVLSHAVSHPIETRQRPSNSSNSTILSAAEILNRGIEALGGEAALRNLTTVSIHANLYRSKTFGESEIPLVADVGIATEGEQTLAYDFSDPDTVLQRIDRHHMLGDFWLFNRPNLEPIDVTIVTKSGPEGYACYTKGNTHVFSPPDSIAGYVDAAYADILVRDSLRLSPNLLLAFKSSNTSIVASSIDVNGAGPRPALTDARTNITVVLDPQTFLPSRIRAFENHQILGPSTSDFRLYNYTRIDGINFPRNMKLLYNNDLMLTEMHVDSITVNPKFDSGFFAGLPLSEVNSTILALPPTVPQRSEIYNSAEVFDAVQHLSWYGAYLGTLPNLTVINPIPSLPNLYHLTFAESLFYTTTLAIFDDAIMVTDAPIHQSELVIQYVQQTFRRNVTHLLITHHHHDHNLGASDYVAIGAKLVVPDPYKYYWQNIPGVQFETASETLPFIHKDSSLQVRGVWHAVTAHCADWMYFTFTSACPDPHSPMGVVTADVWSPGIAPWDISQWNSMEWLALARRDRVARENLMLPIHGQPANSTELYDLMGYEYPDYKTTDFLPGGPWC